MINNHPQRKGGTGEAGVYIRSRENYHSEVLPRNIVELAKPVCDKFGVKLPTFEVRAPAKRRWGVYYYGQDFVGLNLPIKLGTLLHELAHHIHYHKVKSRGGYCRRLGHNWEFKEILNKLFDFYSV